MIKLLPRKKTKSFFLPVWALLSSWVMRAGPPDSILIEVFNNFYNPFSGSNWSMSSAKIRKYTKKEEKWEPENGIYHKTEAESINRIMGMGEV